MLVLVMVLLMYTWHTPPPDTEILTFTFYDAAKNPYASTRVRDDMRAQRTLPADTMVLLIETPTLQHRHYLRQSLLLSELAEQGVIPVVACPTGICANGYHLDMEAARALTGTRASFRVLLLDSQGIILKVWKKPVSTQDIHPRAFPAAEHAEPVAVETYVRSDSPF